MHGKRQHCDLGVLSLDDPGRLDPVHVGHRDVHQDDIGQQLLRQPDSLGARLRLTDDLDLGIGREEHLEATAHYRVVVNQ